MRILPGQFDILGGSVPRTDEWWDIFDTNSGVFLPRPPHIENCGIVRLFPQAGTLTMMCPDRGEASIADVEDGMVSQPFRDPKGERLRLPSLAGSVAAADGSLTYLVGRKGELFILNFRDRSIASAARLDLPEKTIVANGLVALSPAGDRLYVGVGQPALSDRQYGQNILAFDTGSWKQTRKVEPARSVFSMAVAQDGRRLYTVDPATRTVYDVNTGEQVGLMENIGTSPALVISASYR
jgi:sugar lactone lactonase YvrE